VYAHIDQLDWTWQGNNVAVSVSRDAWLLEDLLGWQRSPGFFIERGAALLFAMNQAVPYSACYEVGRILFRYRMISSFSQLDRALQRRTVAAARR
jgi:hypothetical protein